MASKAKSKSVSKAKTRSKVKLKASKKTNSVKKSVKGPVKRPIKRIEPRSAKSNAVQTKSKTLASPPKSNKKKSGNVGLAPCRDGVLVEKIVESDRTPGGLYIPLTAMERPLRGIVVSAGRGKFSKRGKLQPLDVQPGDEVVFDKHAGTEVNVDGQDYLLVREDEILGVVS